MAAYASRESDLLIDELEEALASGGGRDCEKIMQRVADLFMAGSRRYSDQQIALFDDGCCGSRPRSRRRRGPSWRNGWPGWTTRRPS